MVPGVYAFKSLDRPSLLSTSTTLWPATCCPFFSLLRWEFFLFQSCLNVLTKEEALPSMEKDEIRVEMDQSVMRFLDLARQMEAFFLQKRFLLSALKPELVVREVSVFNTFHQQETSYFEVVSNLIGATVCIHNTIIYR